MGLYTSLANKGGQLATDEDAAKRERLYELARRLGSSEGEARALAGNPDAEQFLEAKRQRMAHTGEEILPEPARPGQVSLRDIPGGAAKLGGEALTMFLDSITPGDLQYSLGLKKDAVPAEGIPPAPPMASPSVIPPERATDFMAPKGMTTPGMATGATLPVGDALPTDIPEPMAPPAPGAPQGTDTSGRRMALALMEGLTRAGAEASNVPGLLELMAGKGRGPTDQTNAEMLRRARELDMQREESANSPLVQMVKKAFGVDVKNEEQAKQVIAAEQAKSGLATEAFKRGEGPAAEAAMERQTKQEQEKARAGVYKRRNEIQNSKAYDKIATLIRNAQDAISDIESGNIQSIRAVAIKLARAAGEVGNLSATEQGQYRNLPGFEGWLNRLKEFAQSEPSEMTREALLATAKDYLQNGMRHQNDLIKNEKSAWLSAYPDTDPSLVDEQFDSLKIGSGEDQSGKVEVVILDKQGNPVGKKMVDAEDVEQGIAQKLWERL